jgi:hypothetical protein
MSASEPTQRLNLEVVCADSATEVFVIDGEFNLKDRGIGYLKTALEPGIYKVKVRAGFETQEQSVILRGQDQVVRIPPFSFVSPAPLSETSRTHEFHIAAAYDESRKVHVSDGHGSSIFIFVRDWTSDTPPAQTESAYPNPAEGLSLHDLDGNEIADLTRDGNRSDRWEPWAGCNVELNPGCYLLNLKTTGGKVLEQTIVAAPGWQTQVFLLLKSPGDQPQESRADQPQERRPDVHHAAILMAPMGEGFQPDNNSQRLAELARLGLANERRVLSEDVRRMLDGKFENPMLGILGAHLLLLDAEPDQSLLGVVVNNLQNLLGHNHPDVEALALKIHPGGNQSFPVPPMLRKSWNLIVNATMGGLDLVPDGSLAEKIATAVWGTNPWLIWTQEKASLVDMITALKEGYQSGKVGFNLQSLETVVKARLAEFPKKRVMRGIKKSFESPFEAINKMRATGELTQPKKKVMRSASIFAKQEMAKVMGSPDDETKIASLVESFNIPRRNLERMIAKFNIKGDRFGGE